MCDVASFILVPPFLGCSGWRPDSELKAFYCGWILINSSWGVFVKAGIRQPLARTLAPLATGHGDIHSWLCFPYTSLWQSPAHPLDGHHNVLSHEGFCFFFLSSMLGWSSDFQSSWEGSKQKNRKAGRNPNPAQLIGPLSSDGKCGLRAQNHITRWHHGHNVLPKMKIINIFYCKRDNC